MKERETTSQNLELNIPPTMDEVTAKNLSAKDLDDLLIDIGLTSSPIDVTVSIHSVTIITHILYTRF